MLDGLVFKEKNMNVSPTIYLNSYYHNQFSVTGSIEKACDDILAQYENARFEEPVDISFFTDFSKAKDRIIFRIVNQDLNVDLLPAIPHIDYLDLSITFSVLVSAQPFSDATIRIENRHLAIWNTTPEELFALAKENTPRLLSWDFSDMHDILSELPPPTDDLIPGPEEMAFPMYILTNRPRLYGATCILYEDMMPTLSEKIGDDFYIIPSSIHEVLLIPKAFADDASILNSMVRTVNQTQVPHEEILSDHVYWYDRNKNQILY